MEERDLGREVMESDFGAVESDLGVVENDFCTEENDFGLDENDLKGSGTRWDAGLLMHSQHLQMQTCTNMH